MILVVDDHDLARSLLVEQLRCLGYTDVEAASSGHEALAAVVACNYRLILMDVLMPVMDGLETTREIRDIERRLNRRHTFIAGVTAIADEQSCYDAGMDGYMEKPAQLETLKSLVEGWLSLV